MIRTGLEILVHERIALLQGLHVGLVTHPAAVLPDLASAIDALLNAGVKLTALFGPEHGLDGSAADGAEVSHTIHAPTNLPIYSLYGKQREPASEMLASVDLLVFDMQDVGVRFYTYLSTLYYVLRGAAKVRVPVVVLDRPTPLDGVTLEGPILEQGFESFVGIMPLPVRHGMTLGELAQCANIEFDLDTELTVIKMRGWRRTMWFDETGLPWIPTSPAMPHLSTATLYPGMCFLEGTNLSEGRGTPLPFEVCGAPWLDGHELAAQLNGLDLSGVQFRPTRFVPSFGKHAGQLCDGVQLHVTDRRILRPITVGMHIIATCRNLAPDHFQFLAASWEGYQPHIDLLAGSARMRRALEDGCPVDDLVRSWEPELDNFREKRRRHLLYAEAA